MLIAWAQNDMRSCWRLNDSFAFTRKSSGTTKLPPVLVAL
jgi:hypothetical protein